MLRHLLVLLSLVFFTWTLGAHEAAFITIPEGKILISGSWEYDVPVSEFSISEHPLHTLHFGVRFPLTRNFERASRKIKKLNEGNAKLLAKYGLSSKYLYHLPTKDQWLRILELAGYHTFEKVEEKPGVYKNEIKIARLLTTVEQQQQIALASRPILYSNKATENRKDVEHKIWGRYELQSFFKTSEWFEDGWILGFGPVAELDIYRKPVMRKPSSEIACIRVVRTLKPGT